jgi:serine protease Do
MIPRVAEDAAVDVGAIAAALRRVTVVVRSGEGTARGGGQGSGIVWSADGTIVTNAHVATSDAATITLADGRVANARVAARDVRRDLALLRIDPAAVGDAILPTPVIGTPTALRPGELVLALGHPLGVEHALAMGVVHAAPDRQRSPYVVADIHLAPGNSGGPLADAQGRIVGVNSMIVGGLGVAISTDVVAQLVARATPRPRLGLELRPVQVRATSGERETSLGLLVLGADPDGAAARAGMRQGDVILGHAGRPFASPDDLALLVAAAGPGGTIRLDIGRAGRRTTYEVRLPAAAAGRARRAA